MTYLEQFYLHFIKPFEGYLLGALIALSGWAAFLFVVPTDEEITKKWEPHNRSLYSAWCRVENRSDVTYEDWLKLYKAGLLKKGK